MLSLEQFSVFWGTQFLMTHLLYYADKMGSVTGKVFLSSHVGSTSSEQHLVGLDWIIVCSSSLSVGQRSFSV